MNMPVLYHRKKNRKGTVNLTIMYEIQMGDIRAYHATRAHIPVSQTLLGALSDERAPFLVNRGQQFCILLFDKIELKSTFPNLSDSAKTFINE